MFLDLFFRQWAWTDKNEITRLSKVGMIKDYDKIEAQSYLNNSGPFCCMITDDNKLECTSCTEEHSYICEG